MAKTRPSISPAPAFPIHRVDSWAKFQEMVAGTAYRSWAFRGQADARWPLFSSLSRYLRQYKVHPEAWRAQEERILRVFRRKAHLFLGSVPSEHDDFQWLAMMQHYGAPTRLLDFTWSPFVAAFFALERASATAAVWALSIPRIWSVKHRFSGRRGGIGHDELMLQVPGNFGRFYLGNDVPFVVTGEPFVMNQRIVAQAGTFVIPGVLHEPVEAIVAGYPGREPGLVKFELDTEKLRDEAMYALYNMNITNATLFPGLDGMARSLAYELEFHWAYDPKTMDRYPGY